MEKNQRERSFCRVYLSKHYLLFMWHFWQRSRHMNTNQFFGEREVSGQIMAIVPLPSHMCQHVCVMKCRPCIICSSSRGIVRRALVRPKTPHVVAARMRSPLTLVFSTLLLPLCGYANYRLCRAYSHFKHWGVLVFVGVVVGKAQNGLAKVRHQMTRWFGAGGTRESANVCVLPGHNAGKQRSAVCQPH